MKGLKMRFFMSLFILLFIAFLFVACTPQQVENHKGVLSIRHNLNDYKAETIPLKDSITFELSSAELLAGLKNHKALETSYNTTFYLTEIRERAEDDMLILNIGLKYSYQSPTGSLLSLFKLNDDGSYINTAQIHVMNLDGEQLALASGSGDGETLEYEQWIGVQLPMEVLADHDLLFFEISGLNILTYRER